MPRALIVVKRGESLNKEENANYCLDRLAKYKIPKSIEFIKSLSITAAGKTSKDELVKEYGAR